MTMTCVKRYVKHVICERLKMHCLRHVSKHTRFTCRIGTFRKVEGYAKGPCDENRVKHVKRNPPMLQRHVSSTRAKPEEHKENPERSSDREKYRASRHVKRCSEDINKIISSKTKWPAPCPAKRCKTNHRASCSIVWHGIALHIIA